MHQVIHNTNDRRTEYSCLQPARGPPYWSKDFFWTIFWANTICVFSVLVTEKKIKRLLHNIRYLIFKLRHIPKFIYEIPRTLGNIVEKCLFQVKLNVQAAQVTILCIVSISSNTILSIDKKFGHVNWRNIDSHIFNRVISLKMQIIKNNFM